MKHLLLGIFVGVSLLAKGQSTFFVSPSASYALPIAGKHFYYDVGAPYYGVNSAVHIRSSFGMGAAPALNIGVMVNKYIGLSVKTSYLFGTNIKAYTTVIYAGYEYGFTLNRSARSIQVSPALIVQYPLKKFSLRSSVGMLIGSTKILYDETGQKTQISLPSNIKNYRIKSTDYGGVTLGLAGALGITVKIKSFLKYNLEIIYAVASYSPLKGRIESYEVNGVETVSSLTVNERETVYTTDLEKVGNSNNTGFPTAKAQQAAPMSSIGLAMGLEFDINIKKKVKKPAYRPS